MQSSFSVVSLIIIGLVLYWCYKIIKWIKRKISPPQEVKRKGLSDIASMDELNIKDIAFDKLTNMAKDHEIILGVKRGGKPSVISLEQFNKSNIQVVGFPGAGKGVFAQSVLLQAQKHNRIVIADPKKDEYLTKLFSDYQFIDLSSDNFQIDLFGGASKTDVINALIESFSLKRKGADSDIYKLEGQEAITDIVNACNDYSIDSIYAEALNHIKAREVNINLKLMNSVNAIRGSKSILELLEQGNIYFLYDEANETHKIIAQLFTSRLMQIKKQNQYKKHITLLGDEFVHLVNKTTVNATGMMRSKGMNFVLMYQSLGDFNTQFSDVDSKEVRSRVMDNSQISVVYNQKTEVGMWSEMTGLQTYDDVSLGDQKGIISGYNSASKSTSIKQVSLFEPNHFLSLPPRVAIVIFKSDRLAEAIKTIAPKVDLNADIRVLNSSELISKKTGEATEEKKKYKVNNDIDSVL